MLLPPEWRIEASDEFEAEFDALSEAGMRVDVHRRTWTFYLERDPFHFSEGLTSPNDDVRVIVTPDPREDAEYVAGLLVHRGRRQVIRLTWLERREL